MKKDIGHLRKVYEKGYLEISSVGKDPLLFFKKYDKSLTKNDPKSPNGN